MDEAEDDADIPVRGGWHFATSRDWLEAPSADSPPEAPEPSMEPAGPLLPGVVTRYGTRFSGNSLGCGTGVYSSDNPYIIAVGPARYWEWACGTTFLVCGPAGCVTGRREDGCPGCGANHLDLSEAGIALVCGDQADVCRVQIQRLQPSR